MVVNELLAKLTMVILLVLWLTAVQPHFGSSRRKFRLQSTRAAGQVCARSAGVFAGWQQPTRQ